MKLINFSVSWLKPKSTIKNVFSGRCEASQIYPFKHHNSVEKTALMLPGMWLGMGTGNMIYKSGKSLLVSVPVEHSTEQTLLLQP